MQVRQILPLTGLRFLAAAWVVLFHIPLMGKVGGFFEALNPVSQFGHEAVPFFFLLSGFILSYNYFPTYTIARHHKFVFLRFARLWPVHFMVLIFVPPLFLWNKSRFEELLMVRIWFHDNIEWNTPAWSISSEWFAYIFIFPLAFLLYKRLRWIPALVLLVTACLLAQAFTVYLIMFPITSLCGKIVFLFLAGSGLYQIRSLVKDAPAELIVWLGIGCFLGYLIFSSRLSVFVLYAGFAMLIFGLSFERGLVARMLSQKWIVWGGLASYSLYMTHYLVIRMFVFYYSGICSESWGQSLFASVIVVVALAALFIFVMGVSYHYLEVPCNRKLRNLWKRFENHPAQAESVTADSASMKSKKFGEAES